jgi:hypothetical protein
MSKEALKLALEALEGLFGTAEQFEGGGVAVWRLGGSYQPKQAIAALRLAIDVQNMASESTYKEALAQPEQEPASVTYKEVADTMNCLWYGNVEQVQMAELLESKKLYTTPPQRTWVGLTGEEIQSCWDGDLSPYQMQCIREIEAKLRELNA